MKRYFGDIRPVLKQYIAPVIWLLIAIIKVERHRDNSDVSFWSSFILFWSIAIILITIKNISIIKCILLCEPIFAFDDVCIYDYLGSVNYHWKDINEVVQVGDCLQVHLYDFPQYLNKIKNPIYAWYHVNRRKNFYIIDIGYTKENVGEMLKLLNECSIKAMG